MDRLTCVISGSFEKFKPEIDNLHSEFQDQGIDVLAPDKGWSGVDYARSKIIFPQGFRPLPTERGMTPGEIEEEFLRSLARASFLYLFNQDGYIGNSAAFEMGNAIGSNKPIYAHQPLQYENLDFEDLSHWMLLKNYVRCVPVGEISEDFHKHLVKAA